MVLRGVADRGQPSGLAGADPLNPLSLLLTGDDSIDDCVATSEFSLARSGLSLAQQASDILYWHLLIVFSESKDRGNTGVTRQNVLEKLGLPLCRKKTIHLK